MDIKDLESIRDFVDDISKLENDLNDAMLSIDKSNEDEEFKEVTIDNINCLWAITHQLELLHKLFCMFKENTDKKYWDIWKQTYPHMQDPHSEW